MSRQRWALVAAALLLAALALVASGEPAFERGIEVGSSTLPRQASAGGRVKVAVELRPFEQLPQGDWWLVIHTELRPGVAGACDKNHRARLATPPSSWPASQLVEEVELELPRECTPGPVEFWVGLYDASTKDLLAVAYPRLVHDRLFLGVVDVVTGRTDDAPVLRDGSALTRAMWLNVARPWLAWGVAALAAVVLAWRRRGLSSTSSDRTEAQFSGKNGGHVPERVARLRQALVFAVLLFGAAVAVDFFKDDAFISLRYARNLAEGHGLVFNPGERVEGVTNVLWTLLFVPFVQTHVDLVLFAQGLGVALGLALLVVTLRLARALEGPPAWAALWLASSSTVASYAVSGMEGTLAALLPFSAAYVAWFGGSVKRAGLAGLLAAGACMTRPELHLLALLVAVPLLVEAWRARSLTARLVTYAAALGVPVLAFHAARYAFYGSLLPNTYFAKTGTGDLVWRAGLELTREMLGFNGIGLLWLLTPFAFLGGKHRLEKSVLLAASASFVAYQLRVGADEMDWFRLYLPALPFLATLAALGLQALVAQARVVGWVIVLALVGSNVATTWRLHHGLDGYRELLGRTEAEIGRFLVRHSSPGALVAAQDMGSAPFHAPGLRFLDFIGLVDATVARTRHELGLHAFVSEGRTAQEREFNRRMQAYVHARNPEWILLSAYPPAEEVDAISQRFAVDPTPAALGDVYALNAHHFGLWEDKGFRDGYAHVKSWRISKDYYVSAFLRRDAWEATPTELVHDALPEGLSGPKATFGEGLELAGAVLPSAPVVAQHAAVVTTWWRLPGPRTEALRFSLALVRGDVRVEEVHVPGDSMFPADRWREGQVLEDRVALLLPPEVTPGTWRVELTVEGQHVELGQLEVRALRVGVDQLIE